MRLCLRNAALAATFLGGAGAFGQVLNLVDAGSTAQIQVGATGGPYGLRDWRVGGGPNNINQQLWFLRPPGGPTGPVNELPIAQFQLTSANTGFVRYLVNGLSMRVDYALTGGGALASSMTEVVTLQNTNSFSLDFRLFQMSDFALGGLPDGLVQLYGMNGWEQNEAGNAFAWTSAGAIPDAADAWTTQIINANIAAGQLTNNFVAGGGDLATAMQWNVHLDMNESWQTTLTKDLTLVPEPATALALGLGAAAILRRKRRSC